jgi:hypothetical protein
MHNVYPHRAIILTLAVRALMEFNLGPYSHTFREYFLGVGGHGLP